MRLPRNARMRASETVEQVQRFLAGAAALAAAGAAAIGAGEGNPTASLAAHAASPVAVGAEAAWSEHDRAAGVDAGGLRNQAEERARGDALAAAGLADEAQRLAVADVEADAVDGVDHAAFGAEMHFQAGNGGDDRRRA